MNTFLCNYSLRNVKQYTKINNFYLQCVSKNQIRPASFQSRAVKRIGPIGWLLLIVPGGTFCLGTWQVQRKRWKENLVDQLQTRINANPVPLPESLEEISQLEYYPVRVRGQFLHDKEVYLGPRSLLQHGDAVTKSSLISKGQSASQGYLVVTPFKLEDREETILINRGWVSNKHKNPYTRLEGQIQGTVDLIGIVRLHENRLPFMPANKPGVNSWFYRDLKQMCELTGADPIFLDATNEFDVKGGPVGSQTRISLRNEHLSYILTWYSLSVFTGFMWYSYFIRGVKF
ncbi:hypothetical protein RN001_009626 [Aquatica leii]|uniref:SURF1-like protein n=1 Tax=Aquatica leii TaxID=1421715 RepID=A0AAN7NZU5_9COLE|nr:hypothetical protein RN001_009626 [Aquatica leii]